jgi:small subunit ribosomal protein S6
LKAYEIIVILDPALTEEEVEGQISEIKEQVAKGNGEVQEIQRWGKRRLAYLVRKRREGYYAFFRLTIDPKTLASLEKNFKISERILKYMKVRSEESRVAPPEKVEAKKPEEVEASLEAKGGV